MRIMQERMKSMFAVIVLVASVTLLVGLSQPSQGKPELVSKIVFSSTRENPECNPFLAAEVFLMSPDGTDVQRLTNNESCTHADGGGPLSPDGKKIVFESNRLTTN